MFYTKEELEQLAKKINETYYPERLERIIKLDIYGLMEKLNLEYEWKYISPNTKLLGMIFFEDGAWYVWDHEEYNEGDMPHIENFKKGTIVINEILTNKRYKEKELFVCGHEVMHWIKDQEYFSRHKTNMLHACKNEEFNKTFWNSGLSERDLIERQTNYLNAAVLMPKDLIIKEFFKKLKFKNIPNQPIEYKVYMKEHIKNLATEFGLNYSPVLYRLYDLKILKRKYYNYD